MPNTTYENFFLQNEIEDQYNSHLDLMQFCTIDNSLVGTAGLIKKINRYRATDGVEKLGIGEGNTKSITASYTQEEYKILLAQGNFKYQDEEALEDPTMVQTGVKHIGTDMFNIGNADVYKEFAKTTQVVTSTSLDFNAFVDAAALFNSEAIEGLGAFAFVNPKDIASLRKTLGEDLKYVESFARTGYIGTVAGINVFQKKDATEGTVVVATKEAVTWFNKKGAEVENERDADTRTNKIFGRKYYVVALTDETKAVKIVTQP